MRFSTMIVALAIALPAASSQAQGNRIAQALELFTATCGKFADRQNELRSYLAQNYKRVSPVEEKEIIDTEAGQVWHSGDKDRFIFASLDNGECAVMTDSIAIEPMRTAFRRWVLDLGKANQLTVQLLSDRVERGDYEDRRLSFIAAKPDAKRGVQYMLITIEAKGQTLIRLGTKLADTIQ